MLVLALGIFQLFSIKDKHNLETSFLFEVSNNVLLLKDTSQTSQ